MASIAGVISVVPLPSLRSMRANGRTSSGEHVGLAFFERTTPVELAEARHVAQRPYFPFASGTSQVAVPASSTRKPTQLSR